ncbi:hypothetical protein DFH06DRAFT_1171092, partial [Mycena polygramma]
MEGALVTNAIFFERRKRATHASRDVLPRERLPSDGDALVTTLIFKRATQAAHSTETMGFEDDGRRAEGIDGPNRGWSPHPFAPAYTDIATGIWPGTDDPHEARTGRARWDVRASTRELHEEGKGEAGQSRSRGNSTRQCVKDACSAGNRAGRRRGCAWGRETREGDPCVCLRRSP